MNRWLYLGMILGIVTGVLTGCAEKEADVRHSEPPRAVEAAPPPVAAKPDDPRPKIVVLGDSITAGHGVEPGHAFPDYLQREADSRDKNYHVVNAGVSGDTTANGLDRLPSIIAMRPEIVVLELGGNDGLRGLPIESTRANLEEMIVRLQQAGAKVALAGMTLPANYGPDYVKRFEAMYEDLAAKHKVRLILFRLDRIADGDSVPLMQNDGIHPNKEGQRRLGLYVARELFGR